MIKTFETYRGKNHLILKTRKEISTYVRTFN